MARHRALFVGVLSPALAAAIRGWRAAGQDVAGVWVGNPNSRQGAEHRDGRYRFLAPQWSVQVALSGTGVTWRQVDRPTRWPDHVAAARATGADVLVSVYFPYRVPGSLLDLFGDRAVNLHPAPLPRHRGPAPIHAMIADRSILTDGAMTLHVMTEGFDEGAIVAQTPVAFPEDGMLARYHLRLARAGGDLLREALPAYLAGALATTPQDPSLATYERPTGNDVALSADVTVADIALRCATLARKRALPVPGTKDVKVTGFAASLGTPTGEKPRIGLRHVEMDVADGRVRLRRRQVWSSLVAKLRDLAIHFSEKA
jgi:folate-dependent phosphoribosylglycinamide formyltransferase PurN